MLYRVPLLFGLLFSATLFAQDTLVKRSAMPWDFLKQKETRIWSVNVGVVLPVGQVAGYADPQNEISGYFFNFSNSKIQNPTHFFIGEGLNLTRKQVRSRTQNGKMSIAYLISPLNVIVIHYDFENSNGKPETIKTAITPFVQYGFTGGFELDYRISKKASSSISLSTSISGENFSGEIKYKELKTYTGIPISKVNYNYVGAGSSVKAGWCFQFRRLKFGAEFSSTYAFGKYFTSYQIRHYSGGDGGSITVQENVKFKTQYFLFYIGYNFGNKRSMW